MTSEPAYSIGKTSTVFMSGAAMYYIRLVGHPGILMTLTLTGKQYEVLIDNKIFAVHNAD